MTVQGNQHRAQHAERAMSAPPRAAQPLAPHMVKMCDDTLSAYYHTEVGRSDCCVLGLLCAHVFSCVV